MSMRRWILAATAATIMWAAAADVTEAKKLIAAKKYDEAIVALEKSKADAKSPDVQKTFAAAYVGQGDTFMTNDALAPRMKYPQALKSYRKALEYDKTNKQAAAQIKTIEDIYKQMGRPIPQ